MSRKRHPQGHTGPKVPAEAVRINFRNGGEQKSVTLKQGHTTPHSTSGGSTHTLSEHVASKKVAPTRDTRSKVPAEAARINFRNGGEQNSRGTGNGDALAYFPLVPAEAARINFLNGGEQKGVTHEGHTGPEVPAEAVRINFRKRG